MRLGVELSDGIWNTAFNEKFCISKERQKFKEIYKFEMQFIVKTHGNSTSVCVSISQLKTY